MVNSSFVHSRTHLFEENAAFHQSSKKTGEKASHPVFSGLARNRCEGGRSRFVRHVGKTAAAFKGSKVFILGE
ncbi:hypothetical protein A0V43_11760 [Geobacillus sp. JS12]|nr:hypothetical protein A0V43_11760 [Geobacillus sp. JS12]